MKNCPRETKNSKKNGEYAVQIRAFVVKTSVMSGVLQNRTFLLLFFFLVLQSTSTCFSQNIQDSVVFVPLVSMSYCPQIPGGDMADRYGTNSNVGLQFLIKTKTNIVFGIDGNYLFGKEIKEELFKHIATNEGYIIDAGGSYADVRLSQRGIAISSHIGKVFPAWGINKNSGVISTIGVGYLQHKIRIDTPSNNVPQLSGDYKKGYDKLTSGISVTEFLGYLFLSSKRTINFFGGFELTQAFTKSRRTYDFDLMRRDTRNRLDLLYGFRIGWILPLYKKMPNEFGL